MAKKIQIIVTLGPSARTEDDLRLMKEKGVDFVRLNMSHSTIEELAHAIALAKKVGIPFIVDTEGSQVRTGQLTAPRVGYAIGDEVRVFREAVMGDSGSINLTPSYAVDRLSPGDILYCDFDSLALCVFDTSALAHEGYVLARVISGGTLGSNKGVYIHTGSGQSIDLPTLTPKDHESIALGLREGVEHVAASFMRDGDAVVEVRKVSKGKMKIISKVECIDGLRNLDGIIEVSDMLLIDRGDLSKEIFLHRIPFTQKIIVHRARRAGKPVVVATNFLESMIQNRTPTRAEVHDIESSITDGASGLTLAAETAIGAYPFECITTLQNLITHVTSAIDIDLYADKEEKLVEYLESEDYLLNFTKHSLLVPPNGGVLVSRFRPELSARPDLTQLPSLALNAEQEMDAEQIAIGAYSPLEGFMTKDEVASVLNTMRIPSGAIWPIPIVLGVSAEAAAPLREGSEILLFGTDGAPLAILHVDEKYAIDKKEYAEKLYGTVDETHPGVASVFGMGDMLLGGKIDLLRRPRRDTASYEITPAQTRRLYESLGWSRVVGFHTRNVPHRSHEFIQHKAMERASADGLFVHPVVGKKKKGDFAQPYIIKSYEIMMRQFYPPNRVVMGAFATYSRYAGPKEALFTALVRQNFGCSHFIVGRDHTGVGDFYHPKASHEIFDQFPDLKIVPVRFDEVFFSEKLHEHVHEAEDSAHQEAEKIHISGTQVRAMLERGEIPPQWFMRPEISNMLVDALKKGEKVFVE